MRQTSFCQKTPWTLVLIFLLLSLGIALAGYLYYQGQKDHFRKGKGKELSAIADLKVKQIVNWRRQRFDDAALIQGNPWIGRGVHQFISGAPSPYLRKEMASWMSSLRQNHYDHILLLDSRGKVRLEIPDKKEGIGPDARRLALEALNSPKAILSNFYQSKITFSARLSFLVPLPVREGSTSGPVGVLLLRIDPYRFLFPYIQSWPTTSRTGETTFFCRQGEDFIIFNELHHYENTPLSHRIPMRNKESSGLRSVYREGGRLFEGLDNRGKQVLATGRAIPDSPWFLMVKEDSEEVYAPLKERARIVTLFISLMILVAGISLGLIWRHQRSVYYRNQYQAELERQALTRHYLYLTKYANDIILLTDQNHRIIEPNDRALAAYGYSKEEILNLTAKDLLSRQSQSSYEQEMNRLENQEGIIYETLHRRKDGTEFPVEISFRSMDIEGIKYHQAIIRDITERKRAEEALKESEESYRNLFENANEAIYVAQDGNIVFLNPRTTIMGGYSGEEIMSRPFIEFIYPDDRDMVIDRHVRRLKGEEIPPLYPFRIIHRDGNVRWVEPNAIVIDWKGKAATLNFLTDITERRQAEEEKRKLEEQLQRAEKMEALGTLAGGVAHDLNNVLGIIVGYSELLLCDEDASSPLRPGLENILVGSRRASVIVQDLLTLARRGISRRQVLNLTKIIIDCQNSPEFKNLFSYHSSVKMKIDLEPDLLNISGSAIHLGKALFNLVSNASEAMPNGGTLTIKTSNRYLDRPLQGYDEVREGDYVVLSVSDTGEGMPAADLERIFEPFYTKKVMGRSGTGLGLAVVWGTVKDHHGYINVQSEEGRGSTFTLYFPVTREEISPEPVRISIIEYLGKGETILIVDDVRGQRDLATTMLGKLNYSVTSVPSGEEAVAYLKEHKVDLLVLDMIMDPGMDGLDTYKRILEIHPQQKAIIVSGFSETKQVNAAQALGAGAYVKKPYVMEKLGLAVRKELDRNRGLLPTITTGNIKCSSLFHSVDL